MSITIKGMTHAELFSYIKAKTDWNKVEKDKIIAEYKIEKIENKPAVLFQQSSEKTDWIKNLSYKQKKYKCEDGTVLHFHHGFYEYYELMKDDIIEALLDWFKHEAFESILVGGWSLGAGVSEIAVQDIFYHTGVKCELINFGTPQAIYCEPTRKLCADSCTLIAEYCNNNDVVTHMPPFLGWTHLNRVKVGTDTDPLKLLNPWKYHTNYDETVPYALV